MIVCKLPTEGMGMGNVDFLLIFTPDNIFHSEM